MCRPTSWLWGCNPCNEGSIWLSWCWSCSPGNASNAFNCLNQQAALRNISVLCPSFAWILTNTYIERTLHFLLMLTTFFPRKALLRGSLDNANVCLGYCPIDPAAGWPWGLTDLVWWWCFSRWLSSESLFLVGYFNSQGTWFWLFSQCF